MDWRNSSKQNKIGQLTIKNIIIKNYAFERVENFKYLGVILSEDKHQRFARKNKKC